MKRICKHTDSYTIVALYLRVFQGLLFIFYHREALAGYILITYTINGEVNDNYDPTHNRGKS
jgi:hypothetical protein